MLANEAAPSIYLVARKTIAIIDIRFRGYHVCNT